jgi:hypothetical protein
MTKRISTVIAGLNEIVAVFKCEAEEGRYNSLSNLLHLLHCARKSSSLGDVALLGTRVFQ